MNAHIKTNNYVFQFIRQQMVDEVNRENGSPSSQRILQKSDQLVKLLYMNLMQSPRAKQQDVERMNQEEIENQIVRLYDFLNDVLHNTARYYTEGEHQVLKEYWSKNDKGHTNTSGY